MMQDNSLYENMYRSFDRVPDYRITENEYLELAWAPRGADQVWRRQWAPSLEQAAQKAIALGPNYDIAIMVNERIGFAGQDGGYPQLLYPQLLVLWHNREKTRRPLPSLRPRGLVPRDLARWAPQCVYTAFS
jgi:hypothetical protein